ncbi:MAG: rhomboid family intramembrane serine protease [Sulfurovum sp.]|nr:rhomboid family intramembrane serine protease [Sulfurovum sp.]MDD3601759.1 rhomboid family intramembrane serine protease [Sulfurovum sp.]
MREFGQFKLTYTIIAINLLAYLFTAFLSGNFIEMDLQRLVDAGALYGPYVVFKEEWWRLGSAMFLHGGMTHLLMNMVSLYLVGRGAEIYFDGKSYITLYFFSGILGAFVSLAVHPQGVGVGASGAVFGLFGALAGFFLAHREKIGPQSKVFMKDFGIIILINIVFGLAVPSVDMSAHIGGLITGFVGGFVIQRNRQWFIFYVIAMVLVLFFFYTALPQIYLSIFKP